MSRNTDNDSIKYISSLSKGIAISFSVIVYYCLCSVVINNYIIIFKSYAYAIILSILMVIALIAITILNTIILDPSFDPDQILSPVKILKLEAHKSLLFMVLMIFVFVLIIIGTLLKGHFTL